MAMTTDETKPGDTESEEENPEPLKYMTWVLKVSIHCKGCERKVKKVLQSIEGVYTTDIDWRQQKVVVTGNVNGETLVKKLIKIGKHAELWPEKAISKGKKQTRAKNKEKQSDPESSEESYQGGDNEKETVRVVEIATQDVPKNIALNKSCEGVHVVNNANVISEAVASATNKNNVHITQMKPDMKQTVTVVSGSSPPATKKKVAFVDQPATIVRDVADTVPSEGDTDKINGGTKRRKKKKKGHKRTTGGEATGDVTASGSTGSSNQIPTGPNEAPVASIPTIQSPPHHSMYPQYPTYYYEPPVQSMNYHTANANNSYTASYYVSPQQYSYHYVHAHPGEGRDNESSPSDLESYSMRPSDSFELFSDENPNGCSVM